MLKTKLLFPTIMLVCTLSNTIASVFIDVPIDELIRSSDLIIKGKVKSKYSQTESMIVEVGVKTGDKITTHKVDTRIPVSTYIIDSDEIIHGQHIKKEVVVKMQGGCGEDGLCLDDSSNYYYQVSDDVVIFLKYDHENNIYISTAEGFTAFKLSKNQYLYREGEFAYTDKNSPLLRKETNATVISIKDLKIKVKELFPQNRPKSGLNQVA